MKKVTLLLSLALMGGLLFANGSSETSARAKEDAGVDYTDIEGPVEFEFWHNYSNKARAGMLEQAVAEFCAAHPNVKVKVSNPGNYETIAQQIAGAVAAGKGIPGLSTINVPRVLNYAASGIIEPLAPYFEANQVNKSDYYEGFLESVSDKNGTLYGLPLGMSAGVVYYNKTWLDELGMTMPETWDEFKLWCKEFHEKTDKPAFSFPYDFNYMNTMVLNATGKDPLGDGTKSILGEPEFLQFALDLKDLVQSGAAIWTGVKINSAAAEQLNLFKIKELAAYTDSSTDCSSIIPASDFEVGTMIGFSKEKGKPAISTASGSCLVIYGGNDQKVKNAAFQLAEYLTNAEHSSAWSVETCMFPVRKSIVEKGLMEETYKKFPGSQTMFENTDKILPKNKSTVMQAACNEIVLTIGEIAKGNEADPAAAWATLTKKVDQILADAL